LWKGDILAIAGTIYCQLYAFRAARLLRHTDILGLLVRSDLGKDPDLQCFLVYRNDRRIENL
jgi:hypothetical protein